MTQQTGPPQSDWGRLHLAAPHTAVRRSAGRRRSRPRTIQKKCITIAPSGSKKNGARFAPELPDSPTARTGLPGERSASGPAFCETKPTVAPQGHAEPCVDAGRSQCWGLGWGRKTNPTWSTAGIAKRSQSSGAAPRRSPTLSAQCSVGRRRAGSPSFRFQSSRRAGRVWGVGLGSG
jgi:hypothetical protein